MAKIIIDQKQRDALTTIEKNLEEISAVDKMLGRGKNADICVAMRTGKKLGKEISIKGRLATRVDNILIQHRANLAKEVQTLAAKYMIALSDEDEALLNNDQADTSAPSVAEEEVISEADNQTEDDLSDTDEYDEDEEEFEDFSDDEDEPATAQGYYRNA